MSECARKGKWFGGCKFEARYDLSPADLSWFKTLSGGSAEFYEKLRSKTYVKDVCTTCGKTVMRDEQE